MYSFLGFLDTLGVQRSNTSLCITPASFKSHATFFSVSLTPDLCNNSHYHLSSAGATGTISARIDFKTSVAGSPLKLLAFASHQKCLLFDQDLNTKLVDTV